MSTEVAIYSASVPDRMRYAEALSGASLLPDSYRGKPANVLLALEYGSALDIAPMVAIQQVHIIQGRPVASAQLIGALVRKAGHRLRVTGDDKRAVCEITRSDDPDFTFRAEWTMERATAAKLTGKDTWRQYPGNMLRARAITECARDACPEALAGISYTAEELGDDTLPAEAYPQTSSDGESVHNAGHGSAETAAPGPPEEPAIEDAVVVDEPEPAGAVAAEGAAPAHDKRVRDSGPKLRNPDGPPSDAARRMMFALLKADDGKARPRDESLAIIAGIVGREVESSSDLTAQDVSLCIEALKAAGAA